MYMSVNDNLKGKQAIIILYWTVNKKRNILTCQEFPSAELKGRRKTKKRGKGSESSLKG